MRLTLPYGGQGLSLAFSDDVILTEIGRPGDDRTVRALTDSDITEQLTTVLQPLREAREPLVVVNDHHRATPTERTLRLIRQIDLHLFDRLRFVVATGTHSVESLELLHPCFGELFGSVADRVLVHDCRDESQLVTIGHDRFGEPVKVNRQLLVADAVLTVNSVEPHYFAGYTGGRKSIIPGLADFASVERNHNLAVSLDAQPLRLDGNPVAEHLNEMVALVSTEHVVSLQLVVTADQEVVAAHSGSLRESFLRAVDDARDHFSYSLAAPYDLVIAQVEPPLDDTLYQAQKGLENCQAMVRDGGAIVVLAACRGGVGSPYFFDLAREWNRQTNQPGDGKPRFGMHKLARVNALGNRITVALKSELRPDDTRQVFYEPIAELQPWIDNAVLSGEQPRVLVVHNAAHTVVVRKRSEQR